MSEPQVGFEKFPNLTQVWPVNESRDDAEVDIVAVHGLGATPDTTWLQNGKCWLKEPDMLPKMVPKSRIWTFNYQSKWLGHSPKQNLESLGGELRQFIGKKLLTVEGRKRPIVFVAHSFGGIVVAQALTLSSEPGDAFLDSVKGMVFLGTPFRGSYAVNYAKVLASTANAFGVQSSKSLLNTIIPESKTLQHLIHTFSTIASERQFNISCFYEKLPTYVIKHSLGPLTFLARRIKLGIVGEGMACLDGHRKHGLDTSHTHMNEFENSDDDNYICLSNEIRNIVKAPQRLPRRDAIFSVPYLQNAKFVGRRDILSEIRSRVAFQAGHQTRLALWGLGGIGKTQIATAYAYSIRDSYGNDGVSIFFVRAANLERFTESYIDFAIKAGIKLPEGPVHYRLRFIADWLQDKINGRWLMILDNADDIDLFRPGSGLSQYIPQCEHGLVLITSRYIKVCSALGDTGSIVHIENLSLEDCRALIKRHLPKQPLDGSVDELIVKLEHHPLALTQATAYMQINFISTARYLQLYDENETSQIRLLGADDDAGIGEQASQETVAATWIMSFKKIKEKNTKAAAFLSFMCLLDRQDIPRSLLPAYEVSFAFDEALGTLQGYAMISSTPTGDAYNMHGLIQLAMRNWLRVNGSTKLWMGEVLNVILTKYPRPPSDMKLWPTIRRYIPHALSVLWMTQHTPLTKDAIFSDDELKLPDAEWKRTFRGVKKSEIALILLMAPFASYQTDEKERQTDAKDFELEGLQEAEGALGRSDEMTLQAMLAVASSYSSMSINLVEAEEMHFEVIHGYRELYGVNSIEFWDTVAALGDFYKNHDRVKDAFFLFENCLERARDMCGPDSIEVMHYKNHLGLAHRDIGNRTLAAEILEEVVQSFNFHYGDDDTDTMQVKHHLSRVYMSLGRWRKAHGLRLELYETTKRFFGPNHNLTLESTMWLVETYRAVWEWDAAKNLCDELYLKCQEIYGEDCSRTQECLELAKELHSTNLKPLWRQVMEYEAEVKKEMGEDWVGVHQFKKKAILEIA